jgi:hypothetical protein
MAMPPIPHLPTPGPAGVIAIGSRALSELISGGSCRKTRRPPILVTPAPTTTQDGTVGFVTQAASPFGGWWEKVELQSERLRELN